MTALYELLLLKSRRGKPVQFLSRGEVFARLPNQWRNSEMYQRMKEVPQFNARPPLLSPTRPAPGSPSIGAPSQPVIRPVTVEQSSATPTPAAFKSPRHVAAAGNPLAPLDSNQNSLCFAVPAKPVRAQPPAPDLLIRPPPDENRSFDCSAISAESFTQSRRKLELDSVSGSASVSDSLTQPASVNVSLDSNQVLSSSNKSTTGSGADLEEVSSEQFYQLLEIRSRDSSDPSTSTVPLANSAPPSLRPSGDLSSAPSSNHSVEPDRSNSDGRVTTSGNVNFNGSESPNVSDDWRLPSISPIKLVTFSKSPQKNRPSVLRRFSVNDPPAAAGAASASVRADTMESQSRRPVTIALPAPAACTAQAVSAVPVSSNAASPQTPSHSLAANITVSADESESMQYSSETLFVTRVCFLFTLCFVPI